MLRYSLTCALLLLFAARSAPGQVISHPNGHLNFVYPAGGQQGQTVAVKFGGAGGLAGASSVIVDGPPGVTVSDVKSVSSTEATANFTIAPDAAPGRRMVRVAGGANGLTNARAFFVGKLPEVNEAEPPAAEPDAAQDVAIPVIVNGRLNPTLDVDRYRFTGKQGQQIVAAVLAHRMDVLLPHPSRDNGYLDVNLELTNEQGAIIAAADDTLGLDPMLHVTLPADGAYTLRLRSLSYLGFPEAVYRLTLGEVPYPTSIFPPGGRRGETIEVELAGPNVPPGTRRTVTVPADGEFHMQYVALDGPIAGNQDLPFHRGDLPELRETTTNHTREAAQPVTYPVTINGRFDTVGEQDWYRVHLKQNESIHLETVAQRHIFSPVDTDVEIYDGAGKRLAANDDGRALASECAHDFASVDSWLAFTPPAEGDYFIRIRDQANVSGPRALYRLMVRPLQPDFKVYQWPDAVPIWGAGSTATLVVPVYYHSGFGGEVDLRIEGLPPGWSSPPTRVNCGGVYRGYNDTEYGIKALMTITAPADAKLGVPVSFRVVGKSVVDGRTIEHPAQPLSLLGNGHNDRMHTRFSDQSRAVVCNPLDCQIETAVRELQGKPGETIQIPVKLKRLGESKAQISLTVEGETVGAAVALQPPIPLSADQNEVSLALKIDPSKPPGDYGIVVSRSWASDLRAGRPGPCTPLIILHVVAPAK